MKNYENTLFFIIEDISFGNYALSNLNSELTFAHIGVNIQFHEPLTESLTILLYCLVNSKFQIDHQRKIEIIY